MLRKIMIFFWERNWFSKKGHKIITKYSPGVQEKCKIQLKLGVFDDFGIMKDFDAHNETLCFFSSMFSSRYIMLMALGNMKFIPSKCKNSMLFSSKFCNFELIFSLNGLWKFFETLTWILLAINWITKHEIIYCNWAEKKFDSFVIEIGQIGTFVTGENSHF